MSQLRQSYIRNRLLRALRPDDFALLAPALERVPLPLHKVLVEPHLCLQHAFFVEDGLISFVADAYKGKIEVGLLGREGLCGIPLVLGTDRGPFTGMVQAQGEAWRIAAEPLCEALDASRTLRGVLGRYVQSVLVQVSCTLSANTELNIEARLARWLLMAQDRLGREELPLTHEFLALMLDVRRSGVTVATQVLEGDGLIRAKRGRIALLDREKLKKLTGGAYGRAEAEYERLLAQA